MGFLLHGAMVSGYGTEADQQRPVEAINGQAEYLSAAHEIGERPVTGALCHRAGDKCGAPGGQKATPAESRLRPVHRLPPHISSGWRALQIAFWISSA